MEVRADCARRRESLRACASAPHCLIGETLINSQPDCLLDGYAELLGNQAKVEVQARSLPLRRYGGEVPHVIAETRDRGLGLQDALGVVSNIGSASAVICDLIRERS